MELTPAITLHLGAALGAVATGPVALWARLGARQRPRLHRAFGYAWVTLMLVTATSALFIRDRQMPNIAGFTPIHLLVPLTIFSLVQAFRFLARGNIAAHARTMRLLYLGACVVAGLFTLLPQRYLGRLLWGRLAPLAPIAQNTPPWVWGLLAGLVVLGWMQSRDRTASLGAVTGPPVGMALFGLWGSVSAFGRSPLIAEALVLWLIAFGVATAILARRPAAAWYDRGTRTFDLAGSWAPLALFLAVFLTRYAVSVQLALHPLLAEERAFALPAAALYGAFSGVFAGRAARLWRLALRPQPSLAAA
ncbi:hypothetical protein GCM10028796_17690 [Ramlibacter monticola]|uniref:DUF2306 domain-containing protein n=1 Tax=Ramlibacter monticola TaxID=1926872 RepID=A0A936YZ28_9BURK|nr:DUF2306 domain-containing protein [Ramlibacter monticola]